MKERLYLIDGHALIFKMYYAFFRHPMVNSKGADMSILFGFTKYLLELVNKEKPEYLAVAFDPPGGTFRNELYPEYKANRAETPQLVIDALEPLRELCEALSVKTVMMPGFEADDVIGSMSRTFVGQGVDVYMLTPDKDYGQLVRDGVFQVKPGKSGGENEIFDSRAICEKYNIDSTSQVVEMLTICGDTADNVPGVKGVGEVGAGKLLRAYGTVENIYAHLDELSAKQKSMFEEAREHIALSHELVTIKTDIDTGVGLSDMTVHPAYNEKVAELFAKYEFGSLVKFLDMSSGNVTVHETRHLEFCQVPCEELVKKAMEAAECAMAFDSAHGVFSEIDGIVCACRDGKEYLVSEGSVSDFSGLIGNPSVDKYGMDLKTAVSQCSHAGIALEGRLYDLGLMHYLIDPEKSHKLDMLSRSYLGVDLSQESGNDAGEGESFSLFDEVVEDKSHFRAESVAMLQAGKLIRKELEDNDIMGMYGDMEAPLMNVLARMESAGVKVDSHQLSAFASQLRSEASTLETRIREEADEPGLNISSPLQVGNLLFGKLKLDPKVRKSAKGSYPTDEKTLSSLEEKHPIVSEILEYRAVKKLLSTYIEPFPSYISSVDGRIHTTFNQALTATGRLSSSNPNLQNIPIRTERGKEIRKAFVAGTEGGVIVSADYSQIELRIMAHLSQDEHLQKAFRDGIDVHAATAAKIFGISHEDVTPEQRRIAKTANFGIMYGISSFGLAQNLKVSRTEAKQIIDDYFEAFPAIRSFIADTVAFAREHGYVQTLFGRRRYLPDIDSKNATVRALAERNAVNAPIQGTSADIIKMAMVNIDRRLATERLESRMVLQIHDELLFDVPAEEISAVEKLAVEEMEHVTELSVPLIVECGHGTNWLEAH